MTGAVYSAPPRSATPGGGCSFMKPMVLKQPADVQRQPLALDDVPVPEPGPDEVRVRVQVCGVCRTELHIVEGELPTAKRPVVPGHEVVGIVDRVGSRVRTVKVGDRVGIAWLQRTCGTCEFCLDKQENLCLQAQFTGYHVDGGYAEYAVVPADYSYPIPNVFGDEEAAPLLCAGIIGYRALRLSGVEPGQHQAGRPGPPAGGGGHPHPDPHPTLQARRCQPCAQGFEGRHDERGRRPYPLTQSNGSRRATLRASLACSVASTTALTSL